MLNKNGLLKYLKTGLIVSCQALPGEPLHGSNIMSKMALAAKMGGAKAIRANGVDDIEAIKKEVDLPIVAIIKRDYNDSSIYITATMREVDELAALGVDIIALDATARKRPQGLMLSEMVSECQKKYPNIMLMADCATCEEALSADNLAFDLISTTLLGYTDESRGRALTDDNYAMLRTMIANLRAPIIAEGGVQTPQEAKIALQLGCHAVVVGGAITRPMQITERFVCAMNEFYNNSSKIS